MATLDTLYSLGKSVARGVPQLATGFVDLAALPLTMTGIRQPEQIFGSTAYLTEKGLLPPPQTGLLNQGAELASSMVNPAGLAKIGLLGTTAYHGSPYLFNKFDINKIGSGEGAQAYGHGMYFAENPEVAKLYRDALKFNNDLKITTNGDLLTRKALEMSNMDTSKAVDILKSGSLENVKMPETFAKYMVESTKGKMQNPEGTLYKVDIPDTSISKMLDWDKPIGKQSKEIQKAIFNTKKDLTENNLADLGNNTSLLYGKDVTPEQFLNTWSSLLGKDNAGEELLKKYGVTGVKYLDEGSRAAGKGTSNFVVFDPSEVKILEKGLLK